MKRTWKEKLDETGLKLIEAHAKLGRITPPVTLDPREWSCWLSEQKEVLSSYPELGRKRKIRLKPRFVQLYLKAYPELRGDLNERELESLFTNSEWPSFTAECLELAQRLALDLESDAKRIDICLGVAGGIVALGRSFSATLETQFGKKTHSVDQTRIAIAQHLEWIAAMLRGRIGKPPGRVNIELAKLVDAIREHQKEPLTQLELYTALKAARAELPENPEAFRLWLHRARKSGLVKSLGPKGTKGGPTLRKQASRGRGAVV